MLLLCPPSFISALNSRPADCPPHLPTTNASVPTSSPSLSLSASLLFAINLPSICDSNRRATASCIPDALQPPPQLRLIAPSHHPPRGLSSFILYIFTVSFSGIFSHPTYPLIVGKVFFFFVLRPVVPHSPCATPQHPVLWLLRCGTAVAFVPPMIPLLFLSFVLSCLSCLSLFLPIFCPY